MSFSREFSLFLCAISTTGIQRKKRWYGFCEFSLGTIFSAYIYPSISATNTKEKWNAYSLIQLHKIRTHVHIHPKNNNNKKHIKTANRETKGLDMIEHNSSSMCTSVVTNDSIKRVRHSSRKSFTKNETNTFEQITEWMRSVTILTSWLSNTFHSLSHKCTCTTKLY